MCSEGGGEREREKSIFCLGRAQQQLMCDLLKENDSLPVSGSQAVPMDTSQDCYSELTQPPGAQHSSSQPML